MKRQKISIGLAILIKDNGVDICGGAVERKSRTLQVVDTKSI